MRRWIAATGGRVRAPFVALCACLLLASAASEAPLAQEYEQRIENPIAVFAGLDKITARILSFEVPLNESRVFGVLEVTPRICYTRPATETPLTSAFVEINELRSNGAPERIFTGWMFADSPGLSAVEHPVYDVWLTNCRMTSASESEENE